MLYCVFFSRLRENHCLDVSQVKCCKGRLRWIVSDRTAIPCSEPPSNDTTMLYLMKFPSISAHWNPELSDRTRYLCLTVETTFSRCGTWAVKIWRLCGHTVPVLSMSEFRMRWVSSYSRPFLHLSATLENSTLRLDCVFSLQVSLLHDQVDRMPCVSPDFSMQLDFAQSKNLSQHARPGSTVLTLPQSSLLLSLLLTSILPSFQDNWWS